MTHRDRMRGLLGKVATIVAETEPEHIKSAVIAYGKNWMKSFRLWHPHWLSRLYLICTARNVIVAELWKKSKNRFMNQAITHEPQDG